MYESRHYAPLKKQSASFYFLWLAQKFDAIQSAIAFPLTIGFFAKAKVKMKRNVRETASLKFSENCTLLKYRAQIIA